MGGHWVIGARNANAQLEILLFTWYKIPWQTRDLRVNGLTGFIDRY
ncbi:hypothetical protein PSYPI_43065, partial [Pseudomonas syringae pv. pisi str. 1704B]